MLKNLHIKNFALIEDLEMNCSSGLNVLTGETGAGKSILIDALNILLGEKAGPGFIRADSEKAIIEGIFITKPLIIDWLKAKEFLDETEIQDDKSVASELTITREIAKTGSRFRINSILANQTSINELKQLLIHVHAQHDARTLLSSQSQLDILDSMADPNHRVILTQLENLYGQKVSLKKELEQMQMSEEERVKKLDFAKFQLDELQMANITHIDEDEQLEKKRTVLANVAQLDLAANNAYYALSGGNTNAESTETDLHAGAVDSLQRALSSIEKAIKFDNDMVPISDILNDALSLLEEAQFKLRHYKDNLDIDPEALQEIEARIAQLATIKRKYGPSLEEAANKLNTLSIEIAELENMVATTHKLESELKSINAELSVLAITASKNRRFLAKKLATQMKEELADLGMENCQFEVLLEKLTEISASGFDRIEFMISPNPGQPLLPLAKIASGGELSRIMLALKSIVTGLDDPPTVIFDEIDTGLSGRIVQAVRDKLVKLARLRQILCITHQPIIAAAANNHLFIEKLHSKANTNVTIKILVGQDRVEALAAMASGGGTKSVALDFAQALINQ